ncbi:MAG: MFS transporter [bacterium]|nr:MFS transporter [bacterium]
MFDAAPRIFALRSPRGLAILAALILASSTAFLLGSALGVALPAIQAGFAADLSAVQWVMNAHLLVESALLPASGALSDIYGRRRIFLLGIVLFTVSGAASALVPGIPHLIATQACQGLGGALMIPGSLALIQTHFREADRGLAIGVWAGVSAATAAMGPPLGGFLVAEAGWRSIFAIVIPLGSLAAATTLFAIPASASISATASAAISDEDDTGVNAQRPSIARPQPDWVGAALLGIGLCAVSYVLIFAPGARENPDVYGQLAAIALGGVGALTAFVFWQRRARHPMIPGRLFEQRDVIGANLITLCLYFALNGTLTFSIFYLQQIQEFPPQAAGIALLPTIILIALLSGPGGMLADRFGLRPLLMIGTALAGMGMFWIAGTVAMGPVLSGEAPGFAGGRWNYYAWHYLPGLCLLGSGMACVISPVSRGALRVTDDLTGTASGINNAVSRIASLLSIALLGAVLTASFLSFYSPNIKDLSLPPGIEAKLLADRGQLGAIQIPEELAPERAELVRATIAQAFHRGYVSLLIVCGSLAWASALLAAIFIRRKARSQESAESPAATESNSGASRLS